MGFSAEIQTNIEEFDAAISRLRQVNGITRQNILALVTLASEDDQLPILPSQPPPEALREALGVALGRSHHPWLAPTTLQQRLAVCHALIILACRISPTSVSIASVV